jgi:hypothetical protein
MQRVIEDVVAVRQEILDLLRQQMEALDSPLGLTDTKLKECYDRQTRVQELREQLQTALDSQTNLCPVTNELSGSGTSASI